MNKILIRCDGEELIIDTIRKISEISCFIEVNSDEQLIVLDDIALEDEGFKAEIAINPRSVTLIKEVTEDEWINKLTTEVIKKINENVRINKLF